MSTVKINPNGGKCSWTLSLNQLKVGVYTAILFNSNNKVLERWDNPPQRTDDGIPDTFVIKTQSSKLKDAVLWWDCIASDPTDQGGPYVCTVSISQDGKILSQDPVTGNIPAGNGKLDHVADQIIFIV